MGPIGWIYISETCNDQAASVCSVAVWLGNLIIVIIAPYLYKATGGAMWLIYASITAVYFLICNVYMKETRGLSEL